MKVYITWKKGEETPTAAATISEAAANIGLHPKTVSRILKREGMYSGKKGKVWESEINKIKGRGDQARFVRL